MEMEQLAATMDPSDFAEMFGLKAAMTPDGYFSVDVIEHQDTGPVRRIFLWDFETLEYRGCRTPQSNRMTG